MAQARNQSPIARMIGILREEKYSTTKEEEHVLVNCANRIKRNGIQGFIAAGSIVWSVTGGLNLVQRLTSTVAGATAAGYWIAKKSVSPCIEDILALDGSRLQEKLALILQKEQIHNLRIRALLEKHYYLEPLYTDNNQDTPSVLMRKRDDASGSSEKMSEKIGNSDEDTHDLQKEVKVHGLKPPKRVASVENLESQGGNQAHMHNESIEYPFGTLVWDDDDDVEGAAKGMNIKHGAKPRSHKSKMGVLERREYNRMRYLHWEEKRNASKLEESS